MAYYVLDESKNIFEGMTKEQIMAAIVQAVNQGTVSDIDAGFVTKLQEQNDGDSFKVWIGTSAEYAALTETDEHTLYMITDDTTFADIQTAIQTVATDLQDYKTGIANGTIKAAQAENASNAGLALVANVALNSGKINSLELKRDSNGVLKIGDTVIPQRELLTNTAYVLDSAKTVYTCPDGETLDGATIEIRYTYQNDQSADQSGKWAKINLKAGESKIINDFSLGDTSPSPMIIDQITFNLNAGGTVLTMAADRWSYTWGAASLSEYTTTRISVKEIWKITE